MFSESSSQYLVTDSCHIHLGWTHSSPCHSHSSFASVHADKPAWTSVSGMSGKQVSDFFKTPKPTPLWLLQTSWSRADLWCFASLLSITRWWFPPGNRLSINQKREQKGWQVKHSSSAFYWGTLQGRSVQRVCYFFLTFTFAVMTWLMLTQIKDLLK